VRQRRWFGLSVGMEPDKLNRETDLMDAIHYFSDPLVCLKTVSRARWPRGPTCPRCACRKVSFLKTRMIWTCLGCRKQFSVKVGTILEDSAIGLDKWLTAMWLIANYKNRISSYQLARDVKVTQRSAWFMLRRLRHAMQAGSVKLTGMAGNGVSYAQGSGQV